MGKNTKLVSMGLILVGVASIIVIGGYSLSFPKSFQALNHSQSSLDAGQIERDWSNDQEIVGAYDTILVGKVLEKVGGNPMWSGENGQPHTLFDVEVIYNLKGSDRGIIQVKQDGFDTGGGVRIIQSYDPLKEVLVNKADSYLLNPGYTYLLLLKSDAIGEIKEGFYMAHSPRLFVEISSDDSLTNQQLINLAKREPRVYELLVAYINEVPFRIDILNQFKDLTPEEQQAVYDKIAELEAIQGAR